LSEKIKPILDKVKGFFSGMSKTVRRILIVALCVTAAVIAGLLLFNSTRPYDVLYTGMNEDDMQEVLSFLGSNNITKFKVRGEDTILVPEGQVAALKAKLAMAGYPSSGYGYGTYLDNVGVLSSQADRDQLSLYDLQDRLGATIKCFDNVKDATVFITVGEDERYILDRENMTPATAAVTLTMQGNTSLTNQQAAAIRNLVARSVKGLDFDQVEVHDTMGRQYTGGETADATDASALRMALESQVNNMVRNNILEVLVPLFGAENLYVSVNSMVDVSRTYEEQIQYSSPHEDTNWDSLGGHGLIGEYVWDNGIVRGGDVTVGGVPGTSSNADLNEYMADIGNLTGDESELGTSGSIKHDNDKLTTQRDNAGGVITDIMVAVTINSRSEQAQEANLNALIAHVGRAAGIQADVQRDKISILTMPFYINEGTTPQPVPVEQLPSWMLYALIAGIVLFLLLLILVLLLVRRSKKRKAALQAENELAEAQAAAAAAAAAAGEPKGAHIMDLHSERTMELRKDVREFAEENPEIAAQMVRTWLRGGGEEHA